MEIVKVRMPRPMIIELEQLADKYDSDVSKEIRKVLKNAIMKRRGRHKKRFY